ncbi:alkylated DNA repair protein alkB 6 [Exophiala viscosa]|uniref:Alkylated DNA repair protein alkB 6 n=1 Tax=Exophiala viscosa TaxID=2486360 RepID=A0AAN6DTA3_9EURO|nr:alkylated DNA repair protein alkB 6 [Exophiala viscosa]
MNVPPVGGLPPSCYYIPSFITAAEEVHITYETQKLPEARWTVLSHRRLLSLPSVLTGPARDKLIDAPLPPFLDSIVARLKQGGYFKTSTHQSPNHVLINEYKSGEGIMPHEDGPAYNPITATVSLGSHTVLEIYKKNENGERQANPSWRIFQEPRSLLVTTGEMYVETLHGISETQTDENLNSETIANWDLVEHKDDYASGTVERSTRISLTLRDVTKVAKLGGALKFMAKRS